MNGEAVCRRCLLKHLSDDEYYGSIRAAVEALPDEQKCPEAVFEARLRACSSCSSLLGGMCRACGCFVEVRAAKRANRCPSPAPKWLSA